MTCDKVKKLSDMANDFAIFMGGAIGCTSFYLLRSRLQLIDMTALQKKNFGNNSNLTRM